MPKLHDPQGLLRREVYIYALCDPRSGAVRYIGESFNPLSRLTSHIIGGRRQDRGTPLQAWISTLLAEGLEPEMLILERCEKESRTQHSRERHWIGVYGGVENLLNLTAHGGGGGANRGAGWNQTEEAKAKISAALKGKKRSPEQVERMRLLHLGRKHPANCNHCAVVRARKVG